MRIIHPIYGCIISVHPRGTGLLHWESTANEKGTSYSTACKVFLDETFSYLFIHPYMDGIHPSRPTSSLDLTLWGSKFDSGCMSVPIRMAELGFGPVVGRRQCSFHIVCKETYKYFCQQFWKNLVVDNLCRFCSWGSSNNRFDSCRQMWLCHVLMGTFWLFNVSWKLRDNNNLVSILGLWLRIGVILKRLDWRVFSASCVRC